MVSQTGRFALTPTSGSNQNPIDLTNEPEFNSPALHWSELFKEYVHDGPKVDNNRTPLADIGSRSINNGGDMVLPEIKALNFRKCLE